MYTNYAYNFLKQAHQGYETDLAAFIQNSHGIQGAVTSRLYGMWTSVAQTSLTAICPVGQLIEAVCLVIINVVGKLVSSSYSLRHAWFSVTEIPSLSATACIQIPLWFIQCPMFVLVRLIQPGYVLADLPNPEPEQQEIVYTCPLNGTDVFIHVTADPPSQLHAVQQRLEEIFKFHRDHSKRDEPESPNSPNRTPAPKKYPLIPETI